MIDSGNLYGDIISEELAKKLRLKIYGPGSRVGVAKANASLEILGKVRPFSMFIEGMKNPVRVSPVVARGLTHPINLGQAMLRCHEADLIFRQDDIQLKIGEHSVPLHPGTRTLTRPSVDIRFTSILDKWTKVMGGNPPDNGKILDVRINSVGKTSMPEDSPKDPLPGLYKECYKRTVNLHGTVHTVRDRKSVV